MKFKISALMVVMMLLTTACGQLTKETVNPVPTDRIVSSGKTVVIVPFADYTPDSTPDLYWRRNILVNESLEDEFARYGLMTALEEDVVNYLMEEHIIEPPDVFFADTPNNNYMRGEVDSGDWSSAMVEELRYAISRNEEIEKSSKKNEAKESGGGSALHISLSTPEVLRMGDFFGADYIIRGRLIEFERGVAKDDFNPFHVGLLPFFFNSSQRILFGLAKSENYEMMDKMAIGGILGTAVGHANKKFPFDQSSKKAASGHPDFGPTVTSVTDYHALNTALWGVAGVGAAYLAHNGGKVPRAVVQIRIMVQDAHTGRLLWSNRSEVEVIPESIYANQEYRKLIAKAIHRGTSSLVANFISTIESDLLTAPVIPPVKVTE
jgi:hypothetical protein